LSGNCELSYQTRKSSTDPIGESMLTRWGVKLSDPPLNDYPRPHLVREQWQNLNGWWQYTLCSKQAPQPDVWQGDIRVPFCIESPLSGVQLGATPDQRLWYRKMLDLPATEERTLLHFGAVDYSCAVWVNGGYVDSHTGGFDAFSLDISDFIHEGSNEIVVGITDPSSSSDQPRGKQHLKPQGIWYTPVTGIWQTVWVETVPRENHIEEVVCVPQAGAVDVTVHLYRPTRSHELAVRVGVYSKGSKVGEIIGRADRKLHIDIPNPVSWSPDTPHLYDLNVSLLNISDPLPAEAEEPGLERKTPWHGATEADFYASADTADAREIDRVTSYFALRQIRLGPHPEHGNPTLLLNDEPVFHLGPLDQGWWPDGLHTPPSDEAMIYEINYLKSAGFNTLRKHIKVEPARYYYHCDRLGILVWQDMPSGFLPGQFVAPNDDGEGVRKSSSTQAYELDLQRMINRLAHHPCIVVWVLHNEGWGQFDTHRLTQRIRSLDPTRVINSTSGWLDVGAGDIIDRHDYQPEPAAPEGDGVRALVVGEYGGVGWPVEEHLFDPSIRNWGYQTFHSLEDVQAAYQKATAAITAMATTHGLCGAIYTQTTDVEGEVNGLLTYDRAIEKLPVEWLRNLHSSLTGNGSTDNN
jgi:beta-galactosidase/beta-glucuronidase